MMLELLSQHATIVNLFFTSVIWPSSQILARQTISTLKTQRPTITLMQYAHGIFLLCGLSSGSVESVDMVNLLFPELHELIAGS